MHSQYTPRAPLSRITGVYAVTRLSTGDQYVGSSVHVYARWHEHQRALRRGTHKNPGLQRAWAADGQDGFRLTILETIADYGALRSSELIWIRRLKPTLNIEMHRGKAPAFASLAAREKTCTGCRRRKPLCAFRRESRHADGYSSRCRECKNEAARARRAQRHGPIQKPRARGPAAARTAAANPPSVPRCSFWEYVDRSEGQGSCWLWAGRRTDRGYGLVRRSAILEREQTGSERRAHRMAWIIANGAIPDALHVLHRCDNRLCCNPAHLFLGTNSDNVADRLAKEGRSPRSSRSAGRPHLAPAVVQQIRCRYESGAGSLSMLAAEYGRSKSAIHKVVRRLSWPHVP